MLIVNDTANVAEVMAIVLQRHDCHAITVGKGLDALSANLPFISDLILFDISLPGTDDYEVARRRCANWLLVRSSC
jgi:DNA-binding response OmpR family regulator